MSPAWLYQRTGRAELPLQLADQADELSTSELVLCACGEPDTPGVKHRTSGPCYDSDTDDAENL